LAAHLEQGFAEGAMTPAYTFDARPITRKSATSFRRTLVPSLKGNSKMFERTLERTNFLYLLAVSEEYRMKRKWNPGAQFLFCCLIQALDLEDHESFILKAAAPKRGRRKNTELAEQILYEKGQGKKIPQIEAILKAHGRHENLTRDAIREYGKARRGRQKQNKP
jgi:hypothetical protein